MKLRDCLEKYNFRRCSFDEDNELVCDTQIVRVYINSSDFFEFGCYDFNDSAKERAISCIKDEILDREVLCFAVDEKNNTFSIDLEEVEEGEEE